MQARGQISISTLFSTLMLLIVAGVVFQIWIPIKENLLDPVMGNFAYGGLMGLMFDLLPLIVVGLILVYPYIEGIWRSRYQQ